MVKINMASLRGWCTRGRRFIAKVPHRHWKTSTFMAALRCDRIEAPCVIDGPIDGESFLAYVEQFLVPTLAPGDIVIMDNLGSVDPLFDRCTGTLGTRCAKAALRYCREAEAAASKHDRDPFYDGAIAACIAFAEVHLKNREAACKARNHALHQLQSVRSGHPRYADAVEEIAAIRKHDALFGC